MDQPVIPAAALVDQRDGTISLAAPIADKLLELIGFSGREEEGRWTSENVSSLAFTLPAGHEGDLFIKINVCGFTSEAQPEQIAIVRVNGAEVGIWRGIRGTPRLRSVFVNKSLIGASNRMIVELEVPNCFTPVSAGINSDQRKLGLFVRSIGWQRASSDEATNNWLKQLGRHVGAEARRDFDRKVESGFWPKFIRGPNVLDIGFKGYVDAGGIVVHPITDTAIGVDIDYPGYDGRTLPFADNSQDAVFSSHCLEHIDDYVQAFRDWYRVTKPFGHIIVVVPHAHLYERGRRPPSLYNDDHKRFYTPGSLLTEVEAALAPNSYRVRFLEDNDRHYSYERSPNIHPIGSYEIVLVIEKIVPPKWTLRD